jgi:hypothetical protein
MRKIILATTLLIGLTSAAFAGKNNSDKQMLRDLQKEIKNSTAVQWTNTSNYNRGAFSFNGKSVSGFYDLDNGSLIGFGIHLVSNDLPQEVSNAIQQKYADWKIVDAIYFIESNGHASYYAQVEKGNRDLALKISNGHAVIFSRMPE